MDLITPHYPQIKDLCRTYRVRRLELFGSATRADFDPGSSDLDFLVEFEDLGWEGSSDRYFGLLFGLEDLFHRRVDLVEVAAVRNHHFMRVVQRDKKLVYDAGSPQAA